MRPLVRARFHRQLTPNDAGQLRVSRRHTGQNGVKRLFEAGDVGPGGVVLVLELLHQQQPAGLEARFGHLGHLVGALSPDRHLEV